MKASDLINSINIALNEDDYSNLTNRQLLTKLGKNKFLRYVDTCFRNAVTWQGFKPFKGSTVPDLDDHNAWFTVSSKLPDGKHLCNFYLHNLSDSLGMSIHMDITDLYGGLIKRLGARNIGWDDKNLSQEIEGFFITVKNSRKNKLLIKSLGLEL